MIDVFKKIDGDRIKSLGSVGRLTETISTGYQLKSSRLELQTHTERQRLDDPALRGRPILVGSPSDREVLLVEEAERVELAAAQLPASGSFGERYTPSGDQKRPGQHGGTDRVN